MAAAACRAFPWAAAADATLYGISDAAEFRLSVVMQLHTTLARYPTDPAVTGLVDELRDVSPDFGRFWERHDVQAPPTLTRTFRHPAVGKLTVDCDTLRSRRLTGSARPRVLGDAQGSRLRDRAAAWPWASPGFRGCLWRQRERVGPRQPAQAT
ncbi:hypothetical protein [Streptomyces sp. NPDC057301]|uniref:MmyB family transcriptional regulator n=1 Tax=Streptomyces sp. NPDC057301 TaxID=3346093 RepID=UPI003641EAFC